MTRKITIASGLVLLVGLLIMMPVLGGGWAVVTLDHLPENVTAGEAVEIGFMLRGHGVTPVTTDGLSVEARHLESGEKLSVPARSGEGEGHYLALLSFPRSGTWEWGISVGPYAYTQPMPNLDVQAGAPLPQASGKASPSNFSPILWTLAGFCVAASVLLVLRRKPARWAALLAVAALSFGGLGFANSADPASGTSAPNDGISEIGEQPAADLGADIFVAKGCVICHTHAEISDEYVVFKNNFGPNLTGYSAAPVFLQLWLSDPTAVKPDTKMPNLGLSEVEIEALISFLNEES